MHSPNFSYFGTAATGLGRFLASPSQTSQEKSFAALITDSDAPPSLKCRTSPSPLRLWEYCLCTFMIADLSKEGTSDHTLNSESSASRKTTAALRLRRSASFTKTRQGVKTFWNILHVVDREATFDIILVLKQNASENGSAHLRSPLS